MVDAQMNEEANSPPKLDARNPKSLAAPALIVLVSAAYKLFLLAFNAVPFNGDEAIVALMARHILRGERPVFFYGQAYLGSTDAWLVAASFSIFGESVFAIRLVHIVLFAGVVLTTYLLARRYLQSEWGARAAMLWMALPPTMLTLYTTATLGGYTETLLFGNILLLMADDLVKQASLRGVRSATKQSPTDPHGIASQTALAMTMTWQWAGRWLLFGLIAGFAFYTFPLILIYLIPIGLLLLYRLRAKAWREYLIALLGFAAGSLPWWWALIQSGGVLVAEMTGSAVAGTVESSGALSGPVIRLLNFFLFGASAWWGLRYPWSPEFVLPVLGIAAFTFYLGALGYAAKRGPRILWGMIVTLLVTFLLTPFGGDPSGRYFLPLYVPLAIFTAMLLQRFRKQNVIIASLLLTLLVGYNVTGTLAAAAKNPPGITTQFDPVTWIDHTRDQELIDFLLAHDETRGYTNYWVQTPIAFLSGERIISAARLPYHLALDYTPRDDRYPPFTQAVREAPHAFYITVNHPRLDALIRDRLTALGVTFTEHTIGNYHIFYALARKVEPEELGIYDGVTK
jgi:4-amino-4-deoxy-L-arabinose transferase-like glycosyltransferase